MLPNKMIRKIQRNFFIGKCLDFEDYLINPPLPAWRKTDKSGQKVRFHQKAPPSPKGNCIK
jgi:hypothetical protein